MKWKSNPWIRVKAQDGGRGGARGPSAGELSAGGLGHRRCSVCASGFSDPFSPCPALISHVNMLLPLLQIGPDMRGH